MDIISLQEAVKVKKMVGDLSKLDTVAKITTVDAINELANAVNETIVIQREYVFSNVDANETIEAEIEFSNRGFIKGIKVNEGNLRLKLYTKAPYNGGQIIYDSGYCTSLIWDVMEIPFIDETQHNKIFLVLENTGVLRSFTVTIFVQKSINTGGIEQYPEIPSVGQIKVSATDTTAGFLANKLVDGTAIHIVKHEEGANEYFSINFTGTGLYDPTNKETLNKLTEDAGNLLYNGSRLARFSEIQGSTHEHTNKDYLDKIGELMGNPTYNSFRLALYSELPSVPNVVSTLTESGGHLLYNTNRLALYSEVTSSAHTHTNKAQLDLIGETSGNVTYNGDRLAKYSELSEAHTHTNLTDLAKISSSIEGYLLFNNVRMAEYSELHTHDNSLTLSKFSELNGNAMYNSSRIALYSEIPSVPSVVGDLSGVGADIYYNGDRLARYSEVTSASHTHSNKTQLDLIGEVGGNPTYNSNRLALYTELPSIPTIVSKLTEVTGNFFYDSIRMAKYSELPSIPSVVGTLSESNGNLLYNANRLALYSELPTVPSIVSTLSESGGNLFYNTDRIARYSELPVTHTHPNKTQLDLIGETTGNPTYNSQRLARYSELPVLPSIVNTLSESNGNLLYNNNRLALYTELPAVHTHTNKTQIDKIGELLGNPTYNNDRLARYAELPSIPSVVSTLTESGGNILYNTDRLARYSELPTIPSIVSTLTEVGGNLLYNSDRLARYSELPVTHTHTNKTQLDLIGEVTGNVTYNSQRLALYSELPVIPSIVSTLTEVGGNLLYNTDRLARYSELPITHTHTNKAILDLVGESSGNPTYNSDRLARYSELPTIPSIVSTLSEVDGHLLYNTDRLALYSELPVTHTHSNKTQLDLIGESSGNPTYNSNRLALYSELPVIPSVVSTLTESNGQLLYNTNRLALYSEIAGSSHSHSNLAQLDLIGESNGSPTYNSNRLALYSELGAGHTNQATLDKISETSGSMYFNSNKLAFYSDLSTLHTHSNKAQLDLIGETAGNPTYNSDRLARYSEIGAGHTNQTTLDKFGESSGNLTYNSERMARYSEIGTPSLVDYYSYTASADGVTNIPLGFTLGTRDILNVYMEGAKWVKDEHYSINVGMTSIDLIGTVLNYNEKLNFERFKAITGYQPASKISSTYISSAGGETNISIGYTVNASSDIFDVYLEGSKIFPTTHYILNANNMSIDLVGFSLNLGERVDFEIKTASMSSVMTKLYSSYTASTDSNTNIPIGLTLSVGDEIDVFIGGAKLTKVYDFTINTNMTSIDLVDWVVNKNERVDFEVFKVSLAGQTVKADTNDLSPSVLSDKVQNSVTVDTTNHKLQLVNDSSTPGNIKVYGTSDAGVKGWYQTSIDILSRQAIINGNFNVWQRGTSFTLADGVTQYTADRFKVFALYCGSSLTVDKVDITDLAGSDSGLRAYFNGIPTGNGIEIGYTLEPSDSVQLASKTMTLSMYVKSKTVATKTVGLIVGYNTTTTAVSNGRPALLSNTYSINGTTWTRIYVSFTVPSKSTLTATGVLGFNLYANTVNGFTAAGDGIIISQVELNEGSVPLPFPIKTFDMDLRDCMRYYQKTYDYSITPGTGTNYVGSHKGMALNTNSITVFSDFFCKMRITPVVKIYHQDGTLGYIYRIIDAGKIAVATGANYISQKGYLYVEGAGVFTAGQQFYWQHTADAEI